jgi:Zn ribbon nucleic-acid-binding protein
MATKPKLSFGVCCPHCHDADATLALDLADVGSITCSACDSTFSAREARDMVASELAKWQRVVAWCELAHQVLDNP